MTKVYLLKAVFDSLPEYSNSFPTGTTTGKCWKAKHYRDGWVLRIYGDAFTDERGRSVVPVHSFEICILEGPVAPDYRAPDWSNFARANIGQPPFSTL